MGDVWENTVDKNTWRVDVDRTGEYTAVLKVTEVATSQVVHQEDVGLSFRAIFGPDVADVAAWEAISLNVIDHPEKRTVPS